MLQHPLGPMASASVSLQQSNDDQDEGPLGPTVHSVRGSISNFHISKPTTSRFTNCTACSQSVLEEFAKSGFELLLQTAKDPKYLENLTGLDKLMADTNFDDVIECSDDDF